MKLNVKTMLNISFFSYQQNSRPHVIVLKPGQVLYIPWKWWHFAECLETSLSINSWLQLVSPYICFSFP